MPAYSLQQFGRVEKNGTAMEKEVKIEVVNGIGE